MLLKLGNSVPAPGRASEMGSYIITFWTIFVIRDSVVAGIRNISKS